MTLICHKKICLCVSIFILLLLMTSFQGHARTDERISILLGEQKSIKTGPLDRIAIGDPAIAEVKALSDGTEVLIIAKGTGTTNLILWEKGGHKQAISIEVIGRDPREIVSEIQELLKGMEGVSIRIVGSRIVLEGETLTAEDSDRVSRAVGLYPQVISFVRPTREFKTLLARKITKTVQASGFRRVTARAMGGSIVLEGEVEGKEDLDRVWRIAQGIAPDVVNLVKEGKREGEMILMDLHFVEVRRSALRDIGVNWQDGLSVSGIISAQKPLTDGPLTGQIGLTGTTTHTVNILDQKGIGRILSNPRLITRDGETAEFLAGGEIPIPLITANTTHVIYKQYGMILRISPKTTNGRISADISVEVSTLDPSVTVQGVPGLLSRRLTTSMIVDEGESIILAGLVANDSSKDVDRVPFIGQIPILGELFKSRHFQKRDSELLIYVTPRLISSGNEEKKMALEEMKRKFDLAGEEIKAQVND